MKFYNALKELSGFELILWVLSLMVITASFVIGGSNEWLTLIASLTGATALIFTAKGNVWGQILTLIFSIMYAVISLKFRYYGEMITYLFMTSPIAALSIIEWIKHPFEKGKNEVSVSRLSKKQVASVIILTVLVTFIFYFILKVFDTANLIVSTISIATSFSASYLMLLRSPFYALAYGMNDVVLIVLWVLASFEDASYIPMVACFVMFLANDIYGFYNWGRMKKRQEEANKKTA